MQRQRVDRRRLASLLHGELDWIVMKALEKDRTRRYESASAFAADVTRYLSDEPVEACPPSALYRLRKLARRRRGLLTTAALLAGAVIAGTAVSVWQAVEATRAKELAETSLQSETQSRREAEAQRQRAEIERQRANQQRQLAEMNLRRAVDAVDTMLTRAADEKLASVPGVEPVRKQLLNDALRFYERFLEQRDDDPELRFAVAQAWCRIGLIQGRMGYPFEGLPALQDAVRIGEELSGEYPDDPRYLTLLANAYKSIGGTYHLPQNISLSEEPFYRGLAACLRLQRMFPDNLEYRLMAAECQQNLADCYHRTGRTAEGIALAREALATQRELLSNAPEKLRERVVWVYNMTQLADMVSRSNPEEAESLWAEGQALAEELVGTEHADYAPTTVGDDPEMALVSILLTRADQHRSRDDVAEAENLYRRAITVLRPLVAARPNLRYHRLILTLCRGWLADILAEGAQDDEAEALYRENYRTTNDFAEEESANAGPFANVGFPGHADNLISFLHRRGKHEQAAAIRSEHVRMLNRLIERRPDRSELRRFLAAELQKSEGTETGADARPDSVPEPDNQIQPGVSSATADSNPG
ncbi:MAG: tetratricopeptide repeat protein [Planctomycetaceae bacterium]